MAVYIRVSIIGAMSGGEQWSVNPVYDPSGEIFTGGNQDNLDAAAQLIANRTLPADLLTMLTTSASRTGARLEVRDNVTDALQQISIAGSTTAAVGVGSLKLPFQSAAVVSVRTDTPGASGRGRLYWPAMGATLTTQNRLQSPAPATLLSSFKTYLAGIEADLETAYPGIPFNLSVRSKTTKNTPHAVRLQLGDIIDTQRRRRDALPEAYSSVSFP